MRYLKIYISICKKAKKRLLKPDTLTELHHVFPESIFGKNSHVLQLTVREHYLVHWLLWKAFKKRYGMRDEKTRKMASAFHWMVYGKNKSRIQYNITSRMYESARKSAYESKVGKVRTDMLGKKYFGADENVIKQGISEMVKKKTGMKIPNYPKNRKSRGAQSEKTISLMKEKRSRTCEKYKNMSMEEFENWISKFAKYTKNGNINSNLTRAIISRGESISKYYPELEHI